MSNNTKNKDGILHSLGIPAAVILSYVSALCALPSSGFLTSLPVSAILTIVISFFCKQRKLIYGSMAVMHLLTPLLFGYDMKTGIVSTVIAVVSAFFALLAKRAFITVKKTENDSVKAKSKTILIVSAILCVAIWFVCLGNPVSFVMADGANRKTAEERYPGKLEASGTFFDVTRYEYVTEITFEGADGGRHYYISSGKTDDYKSFHMTETLLDASEWFSGKTAIPAESVKSYIDSDEFLFGESGDSNANYPLTEYLIVRAEAVTGLKGFSDLYDSLTVYADESEDLVYKSITMTAKGMDGKTYYAYKQLDKDVVFSIDNEELEKSLKEKFN